MTGATTCLCHAVCENIVESTRSLMLHLPPVVKAGTPVHGNDELEKHLVEVEKVACMRGLFPEAISTMLEFALSLRMGKTFAYCFEEKSVTCTFH